MWKLMKDVDIFSIPLNAIVVNCRTCAAQIVWVQTSKTKRMPVEFQGPHRGESHFSHCRGHDPWRPG